MRTVIWAGGFGTRLSEEIGDKPILWHIMKIYSTYGLNDFNICLDFKVCIIKKYFSNYWFYMSDVTFNMRKNKMEVHQNGTKQRSQAHSGSRNSVSSKDSRNRGDFSEFIF